MPSTRAELVRTRLLNQRLIRSEFTNPAEIVSWLGAVQSQDYAGACWALGLRADGLANTDVERAFNAGEILRTHILRPTWHFVAAADIRWMLALSGPRVNRTNARVYRRTEVDDRIIARSRSVFERVLGDGQHLTRTELATALQRARISATGQRLAYIVMRAELDGVICSGPRRGKQFTYALLERRAPPRGAVSLEEALAELSRRYFTSHGPATLRDYVWWSGLTVRDARRGLESIRGELVHETVEELTYWFAPSRPARDRPSPTTWLLPNYDEFLVAYRDRRLGVPPESMPSHRQPNVYSHHLIVDGRPAGHWTREVLGDSVRVSIAHDEKFTPRLTRSIAAAARRYSQFMGMPVTLSTSPAA
jgi:hypothetical protein